jgi:hypothetical protein
MQAVHTTVRTIIVLLMLALPSTASAAGVEMLRSTQTSFASPQLAGDSVVATVFRRHDTADLFSGTAGRPAHRLLRVTVVNGTLLAAASADRVRALTSSEGGAPDLYGGPLTGPLTKLATCTQAAGLAFPPRPALDGDLSATPAADCVRNRIRMQLGAITRTVDATGYVVDIAAAGHYVAWVDTREPGGKSYLTVYDVLAGQTAYTLQITPAQWLDVQADGTAAVTQFDDSLDRRPCNTFQAHPTYFTVGEPVAHTLPQSTCFGSIKIAGGRIAFVEHLANGGDRLELVNLAGTQVQPVARLDAEPTATPDFDYDGAHVAWTQTRCRDFVVLRRNASDTSPESPAVSCPVHVGSPILRRDGTLHVAVSCPNGCRSDRGNSLSGIQIVSPHWLHVWSKDRRGNTRYSPFVPVNLQAGKRTVVRLPLTSHQRALLRRRHSVSVRLKVLLQNVYLPRVARTAHA